MIAIIKVKHIALVYGQWISFGIYLERPPNLDGHIPNQADCCHVQDGGSAQNPCVVVEFN